RVYDRTMLLLGGLLVIGLICNLLVRPVDPKYFMATGDAPVLPQVEVAQQAEAQRQQRGTTEVIKLVLAWSAVLLPLLWGLSITIRMAAGLFG
ncbi:MAG: MFS transporter, partial [Bacteroidota bacterium]